MKTTSLAIPSKICPSFSQIQNEVLSAYYKPKIKGLKKSEFSKTISKAVTKAYMVMGHTPKDDFEIIVEEIVRDLKANYTTFTVEEVCIAIDLGSKGKLGDEYVHVCVRGVLKWIWIYYDIFRRDTLQKQELYEKKLDKEMEESKHKEYLKELDVKILLTYSGFPESFKNINKGIAAAMYRQLDDKGLIKMSAQEKISIHAGIIKIKERMWRKAKLSVITPKELSEYRALKRTFAQWKDFGFDLIGELE